MFRFAFDYEAPIWSVRLLCELLHLLLLYLQYISKLQARFFLKLAQWLQVIDTLRLQSPKLHIRSSQACKIAKAHSICIVYIDVRRLIFNLTHKLAIAIKYSQRCHFWPCELNHPAHSLQHKLCAALHFNYVFISHKQTLRSSRIDGWRILWFANFASRVQNIFFNKQYKKPEPANHGWLEAIFRHRNVH